VNYSDESRRLEEQEIEEDNRRLFGPPPPFCRTVDEYQEWRAGILDEGELRARRASEVADPVDDDSCKEDPPQPGEPT
jgi:hypothetical protein